MPTLPSPDHPIARQFRAAVEKQSFPCVGAKSALARGFLSIITARDITSGWNDLQIHRELLDWSRDFQRDPSGLRSLVVTFEQPTDLDEHEFEAALWQRLQSLANADHGLGQRYAPSVSTNPDDPHFSLSFGGQAYFVVGLHPAASRPARRFAYPAMVFNLHDQFVQMREKGTYERMRATILAREEALAGSVNPMIARHGEISEARQYSGRLVDPSWRCPFQDPRH